MKNANSSNISKKRKEQPSKEQDIFKKLLKLFKKINKKFCKRSLHNWHT